MQLPLNASATTAGALFSSGVFLVPPYQREYAWQEAEVEELWHDLRGALIDESYFLGLVILTDATDKAEVVDGQQRLLSLTMLAAALQHEAMAHGRRALAERIDSDLLRSIDYSTDVTHPRMELADSKDAETLSQILNTADFEDLNLEQDSDSVSALLLRAYKYLRTHLRADLASDPFKRLGQWTDFLTNKVYFAVFVHQSPASAYRVFEVINTRGRELTTADLLKNYVLSQTAAVSKDARYEEWQRVARAFGPSGSTSLVQYIRHVVTTHAGYILPKDLFAYLAQRESRGSKPLPPTADELMSLLTDRLPLYLQMVDPTTGGPAGERALDVFFALNQLNVIAVRPMLLATSRVPDADEGMRRILELVVRRIVVGNLGTGAVERRLGDAALDIARRGAWQHALDSLRDLNPSKAEFEEQLRKRSYNRGTLSFVRRSILQRSMTPEPIGTLYSIRPRYAPEWTAFFSDEQYTFWGSTIGNTFLAEATRRPFGANDWVGFKEVLLPLASQGEIVDELRVFNYWDEESVSSVGSHLAELASEIWYA